MADERDLGSGKINLQPKASLRRQFNLHSQIGELSYLASQIWKLPPLGGGPFIEPADVTRLHLLELIPETDFEVFRTCFDDPT